jgi:molybdate transport system regulatory protein
LIDIDKTGGSGCNPPMAVGKQLKPRFRLTHGKEIAFGPGKADLLEAVARTGSIAEAARQLDLSYMRAWSMIKVMNQSFRQPVVVKNRGGDAHGGAMVTEFGHKVLRLYRQTEAKAVKATAKESAALLALLK